MALDASLTARGPTHRGEWLRVSGFRNHHHELSGAQGNKARAVVLPGSPNRAAACPSSHKQYDSQIQPPGKADYAMGRDPSEVSQGCSHGRTGQHIRGLGQLEGSKSSRMDAEQSNFQQICHKFGETDFFCNRAKLPSSTVHLKDKISVGLRGKLSCDWSNQLLYTFPSMQLIQRVMQRIIDLKVEVMLVAPFWPWSSWFQD